MDNSKHSVISNLIWRFMERCGSQLISFVVSVVLARLLEPDLYGSIALVTVITSILQVFVDSGMANALIQKKDTDDLDYSSVFYFNLVFCLLLYAGLFVAAPTISRIYNDMSLVPVIRVLGLTLIISGVKNVQQAYVSKTMQFRRFFFATLGGTIFSAVVGIAMAYMGYGVWALVMQQVLNAGVNTAILWLTVGWKPKLMFSIKRLGGLISYGWKLLASALLDTVYNKLYQLVVGVFYSSSDLAYYNKADQLPLLVVENINSSIDSVLLPVLSKEQDKRDTVREMTRRAIKISTYVMMPMMAGLAACAEPLVRLLLTEKWVPCVPYMQIFCVCYAFYPLHTANLNAIKAMGRSDLFLVLELIKKAVGITALLITMRMGVIYMALSRIFTGILAQLINAYPNSKLLKYPYIQQLKDMLPAILLSTIMGFAVYSLSFLGLGDVLTLILQVLLGVVIYAVGSVVFKLDSFSYILNIIKNILHRGAAKE
jgi:O-antigen/teichoic acid export membrane protein